MDATASQLCLGSHSAAIYILYILKLLLSAVEKSRDIITCTKVRHLSHINDTPRGRLIQARYISKKTQEQSGASANNINLRNKVQEA